MKLNAVTLSPNPYRLLISSAGKLLTGFALHLTVVHCNSRANQTKIPALTELLVANSLQVGIVTKLISQRGNPSQNLLNTLLIATVVNIKTVFLYPVLPASELEHLLTNYVLSAHTLRVGLGVAIQPNSFNRILKNFRHRIIGLETGGGLLSLNELIEPRYISGHGFSRQTFGEILQASLTHLLELPSVGIANQVCVFAVTLGVAVVTAGISGVITLRDLNFRTERTDDIDGLGVLNGSNELPITHTGCSRNINGDKLGGVIHPGFLISDLFEGLAQLLVGELTTIGSALLLYVGQLLLQTGHIVLKNLVQHFVILLVTWGFFTLQSYHTTITKRSQALF